MLHNQKVSGSCIFSLNVQSVSVSSHKAVYFDGSLHIYVRDPGRNQTNHVVTGIFICAPDVQNHIKPNVVYTCLNELMSNSFSSNGC